MGAWAMLNRVRGSDTVWKVDGGAIELSFFFAEATEKDLAKYVDPNRCRFVHCPGGVTIGQKVRIVDERLVPVSP